MSDTMGTYSGGSGSKMSRYMVEQIKKRLRNSGKKIKKIAEKELPKKLQDEIKAEMLLEEVSGVDDDHGTQ